MNFKKIFPWSIVIVFSLFAVIVITADIPTDDQIAKILTLSR